LQYITSQSVLNEETGCQVFLDAICIIYFLLLGFLWFAIIYG
jgi:hypothetical protein